MTRSNRASDGDAPASGGEAARRSSSWERMRRTRDGIALGGSLVLVAFSSHALRLHDLPDPEPALELTAELTGASSVALLRTEPPAVPTEPVASPDSTHAPDRVGGSTPPTGEASSARSDGRSPRSGAAISEETYEGSSAPARTSGLEPALLDGSSVRAGLADFELLAALGADLTPAEQDTLHGLVTRATQSLAAARALPLEDWIEIRDRVFLELRDGISRDLGADVRARLERPDRFAGPDLPPLAALRFSALADDLADYEVRARLLLPNALRDLSLPESEQLRVTRAFHELDARLGQARASLTILRESGGALHPDAPPPHRELFRAFERQLAQELAPDDYARLADYQAAWEATWMRRTAPRTDAAPFSN